MTIHLKRRNGAALALAVRREGIRWQVADGADTRSVEILDRTGQQIVFVIDGVVHRAHTRVTAREVRVVVDGRETVFARQEPSAAAGAAGHGIELHEPVLRAPVPGRVLEVRAEAAAPVQAGDVLVVIEAMKMETPVIAPADGTVTDVHVAVGELVDQDQPLVTCAY